MLKFKILLLCVILMSVTQPICLAKEYTPDETYDLALEVFQMTQSFDEFIHLLKARQSSDEQDAELQKLQIAVTYLSFRSRNIELKRSELLRKTRNRDSLEDAIAKIKEDPDQWEMFEKRAMSNSPTPLPKDFNISEYRLKILQGRYDEVVSQIITLENDIQGMVDELAVYEAYVQKNLNLFN